VRRFEGREKVEFCKLSRVISGLKKTGDGYAEDV
jgi:hypothetical protein